MVFIAVRIEVETARRQGVTYDCIAGAVPDIAGRDLAVAAAVGLARDASAVAGRENLSAVDTGLEGVGLRVTGLELVGHGERASGEEGDDGNGEELHFGRCLKVRNGLSVWCSRCFASVEW